MSHHRWAVLALAGALCLSASTFAKGPEHGGGHGNGKNKDKAEKKLVKKTVVKEHHGTRKSSRTVVITSREHGMITEYYRVHRGKHKGLPPGLRKQLVRNGHLPPGLEKEFVVFPPELDRRLPVMPVYCRRGLIGYDVVVIDTRTNLILEIIHDVVHNM